MGADPDADYRHAGDGYRLPGSNFRVFSLTRQAVRLGYLSPMRIIHTSEMESGQIYIPFINWLLYVSVVIVIVSFEHSSNLAAAYGIAVTGTMVLTSILSATVARKKLALEQAVCRSDAGGLPVH